MIFNAETRLSLYLSFQKDNLTCWIKDYLPDRSPSQNGHLSYNLLLAVFFNSEICTEQRLQKRKGGENGFKKKNKFISLLNRHLQTHNLLHNHQLLLMFLSKAHDYMIIKKKHNS